MQIRAQMYLPFQMSGIWTLNDVLRRGPPVGASNFMRNQPMVHVGSWRHSIYPAGIRIVNGLNWRRILEYCHGMSNPAQKPNSRPFCAREQIFDLNFVTMDCKKARYNRATGVGQLRNISATRSYITSKTHRLCNIQLRE